MFTAVKTESQPEAKIEENLSIDKKLYNHENIIENTQVIQEVCIYNSVIKIHTNVIFML